MVLSSLGKCHLLPQGGLLEFGEGNTKYWETKRGEHKKFFLLKGGTEDFHKKDFLGFILRLHLNLLKNTSS